MKLSFRHFWFLEMCMITVQVMIKEIELCDNILGHQGGRVLEGTWAYEVGGGGWGAAAPLEFFK